MMGLKQRAEQYLRYAYWHHSGYTGYDTQYTCFPGLFEKSQLCLKKSQVSVKKSVPFAKKSGALGKKSDALVKKVGCNLKSSLSPGKWVY